MMQYLPYSNGSEHIEHNVAIVSISGAVVVAQTVFFPASEYIYCTE